MDRGAPGADNEILLGQVPYAPRKNGRFGSVGYSAYVNPAYPAYARRGRSAVEGLSRTVRILLGSMFRRSLAIEDGVHWILSRGRKRRNRFWTSVSRRSLGGNRFPQTAEAVLDQII